MSEPAWLALARKDIGIHEGVGPADNPKVLAMFKDAGFGGIKHDSTAWCAAAVGAWLKRSGIQPSGSLLARSYEKWGIPLHTPILGCVGVKKRLVNGKDTGLGHVGLVVGANLSSIWLLAGNQQDQVGIAAFPCADFTAFRWPSGVPIPASLPPLAASLNAARNVSEA